MTEASTALWRPGRAGRYLSANRDRKKHEWPHWAIALLIDLSAQGKSASLVADILNRTKPPRGADPIPSGHVSRNAVIGHWHRKGCAHPTQEKRIPVQVTQPRRAIIRRHFRVEAPPPTSPQSVALAPDGQPYTCVTLPAGLCRYPVGDPKQAGFGYCGQEAVRGAYCVSCHAIMTRPAPMDGEYSALRFLLKGGMWR
jgi:GcrA cell cycle regulator